MVPQYCSGFGLNAIKGEESEKGDVGGYWGSGVGRGRVVGVRC